MVENPPPAPLAPLPDYVQWPMLGPLLGYPQMMVYITFHIMLNLKQYSRSACKKPFHIPKFDNGTSIQPLQVAGACLPTVAFIASSPIMKGCYMGRLSRNVGRVNSRLGKREVREAITQSAITAIAIRGRRNCKPGHMCMQVQLPNCSTMPHNPLSWSHISTKLHG